MKNKSKTKIVILTVGLIFAFISISNHSIFNKHNEIIDIPEKNNLKNPRVSGFWPNCPRIHIKNDNWSTTPLPWIQVGLGTLESPHVIENVSINAGGSGCAIIIENSSDYFIVRNCTLTNSGSITYNAGFFLNNTENGQLVNNNCSNNNYHGIHLYNHCKNNTIFNNTVNSNAQHGIKLETNCYDNTISENTANTNGRCGIVLSISCNNNLILENECNNNGQSGDYHGIYFNNDCYNNTVTGNKVESNDYGIYLVNSDSNTISGNFVNHNTNGIILPNSDSNTVTGNNIGKNGIGIYNFGDDNIVSENNIYGCYYGIYPGDSVTISGNLLFNNSYGIYMSFRAYITISDNFIYNNSYGIYLEDGFYLTISGNFINNNYYGIYLDDSDSNVISGNSIENNYRGIHTIGSSFLNTFYLNEFIGNRDLHAGGGSSPSWDNGFVGNYWDDYEGFDFIPFDGIGDIPHHLYSNEYDTKPLMHPIWVDTDNDGLNNFEEYSLEDDGYHTNPVDPDTDDDSFNDGDEAYYKTNPLDPLWYPMPNLKVLHLSPVIIEENKSFMIDFSVTNNGIWRAQGAIIIVKCEELGLTLFNNTNTPLTLDVEETEYIAVNCPSISQLGTFTLNLTIDSNKLINEDYSSKDGSLRVDAEHDNSQTTELTIIPEKTIIIPEVKTINLAILKQSFTIDDFNISFIIYNENDQYIDFATVQLWWNDTDASDNVISLGNGFYFVSIDPITVAPGEDPILLSMIISAGGYEDKHFETYLAVDPDTLEKGVEQDGDEFPFLILIIAIVSTAGGIGATIITIGILRKRKPTNEVI